MTPNQIATADIIDIVFDGRNKAYGAYQLQKGSNKRLSTALSTVLGISLIVFTCSFFSKGPKLSASPFTKTDTLILTPPPAIKPPAPKPVTVTKPLAQIQYTPPLIIKDKFFAKDTMPDVALIPDAVITTSTTPGEKTEGNNLSQKPAPIAQTDAAKTVTVPEIFDFAEHPAEFPGGIDAWRRYLERNINYPEDAIEHEAEATVKVQFIVDTEGNISDVHAINDPGYGLAQEAVRIIRNGPKWKPAEQNGRKVIFRRLQGITFKLQ